MLQRLAVKSSGSYTVATALVDEEGRALAATSVSGTVSLTDGAGTALPGAYVPQLSAGDVTVAVPASDLSALDTYTVTWDLTLDGSLDVLLTSYAELCGGRLFRLADLRSSYGELASCSDEELEAARLAAEQRLEQAAGVAFVPRAGRWSGQGSGSWRLLLPVAAELSDVVSITLDGEAWAVEPVVCEWGALDLDDEVWPADSVVAVHYLHGRALPVPGPVSVAAMVLAREYMVRSALSSRATVEATDLGFFRLSVADGSARPTGIPEVDAVIATWGRARPHVA